MTPGYISLPIRVYSLYELETFKQDKDPNMKKVISKEDIIIEIMKSEEDAILKPVRIKVKGPVTVRKFADVILRFYDKKLTKADLEVFKHIKKYNPEYLDDMDHSFMSPSKLKYSDLVRSSYVLEGYRKSKGIYIPIFGT